ncbi:MAG: hypothetical protein MJ175_08505 [Clostridia bacterium]|nr:hypothetical protein [Clostridia bacterium]
MRSIFTSGLSIVSCHHIHHHIHPCVGDGCGCVPGCGCGCLGCLPILIGGALAAVFAFLFVFGIIF